MGAYSTSFFSDFRIWRISSLLAVLRCWMKARKLLTALALDRFSGSRCVLIDCQCSASCKTRAQCSSLHSELTVCKGSCSPQHNDHLDHLIGCMKLEGNTAAASPGGHASTAPFCLPVLNLRDLGQQPTDVWRCWSPNDCCHNYIWGQALSTLVKVCRTLINSRVSVFGRGKVRSTAELHHFLTYLNLTENQLFK